MIFHKYFYQMSELQDYKSLIKKEYNLVMDISDFYFLLTKKVRFNIYSLFLESIIKKDWETFHHLLQIGFNINCVCDEGCNCTLLTNPCVSLDTEILNILIINEIDINKIGYSGNTPLCFYMGNSPVNYSIIKCLIKNGADVNKKNNNDQNPIGIAIKYRLHIDIIKTLVENGADLSQRSRFDGDKFTPLYLCRFDTEVLQYLSGVSESNILQEYYKDKKKDDVNRFNRKHISLK